MKTYQVVSAKNRDFAIFYNDKEIGRAEYAKWYSSRPDFKIPDGTVYNLKLKSFWKGTYEILKNNSPSLLLKSGFKSYTLMPYGKEYHFYKIAYRRGFKSGLTVENYKEEKLAELSVTFTFKKFSTVYSVEAVEDYGETELEQFLLVLMVYYYKEQSRIAAAG